MFLLLSLLNLPRDIPLGLLQVLDGILLLITSPDVLHSVPEIEAHVFSDLDTFDPTWMGLVVFGMVHRIELRRKFGVVDCHPWWESEYMWRLIVFIHVTAFDWAGSTSWTWLLET